MGCCVGRRAWRRRQHGLRRPHMKVLQHLPCRLGRLAPGKGKACGEGNPAAARGGPGFGTGAAWAAPAPALQLSQPQALTHRSYESFTCVYTCCPLRHSGFNRPGSNKVLQFSSSTTLTITAAVIYLGPTKEMLRCSTSVISFHP